MSGLAAYGRIAPRVHTPFELPSDVIVINVLHGICRGIAQVFFSGNSYTGVAIVAGMAICSRIAAAAVVIGSASGVVLGLALGVDEGELYNGIWGFNPVLAAAAISIFYVLSWRSFVFGLACCASSCILFAFLRTIFAATGPMTLPFCVSAIFFLLAKSVIPSIVPVPLAEASTPEDAWANRDRYKQEHIGLDALVWPE